AAPPAELQAGDVERRVEHPLYAALVADSPAQLADALLTCIGLGGHRSRVVQPPRPQPARGGCVEEREPIAMAYTGRARVYAMAITVWKTSNQTSALQGP